MSTDTLPPKPTALPVDFDGIPEDLKAQHRFVMWRYQRVGGKHTKVPYQARNRQVKAATDDPKTWASFDEARAAYEKGGFDGIGIVLIADDDLCGVDLDHCVDLTTGEINADAAAIIDSLDSYTTLSPSGTGVRIFVRGHLQPSGRKKGNFEMYESGRYLTLTGHTVGAQRPIAARQAQLEIVHRQIFGEARKSDYSASTKTGTTHSGMRFDDAELLEKMFANPKNGAEIKRLWDGDTSAHGDDASAADLALVSHLLWWCDYDDARADDLFRRSELMRLKWDEMRGAQTYGQRTMDKALEGKASGDGYRPGPSIIFKQSQDDEADQQSQSTVDLLEFFRTDYGNAERLHALFGHRFRYCAALGYLVWDGTRWRPDDGETMMRRFALDTARELFAQAGSVKDSDQRTAWVKHSLSCERSAAIRNAVDLATTIPGVTVNVEELDADPMLLNVENGTIDLSTGKLKTHDPRDLITKLAPVTFDPAAECPLWDEFQRTICSGDLELVTYKQRAYGYTATGKTSEDALFILHGSGANGKSTEQNIALQIFGDYANTAQFESFAVKKNEGVRNDIADLMGARFVSASEGESRQRLAEGLVKQMTGGDILKARFLHKEYFKFKPTFKLWLATNHKPVIRGTDGGIWRRIRLIPYAVTIPPEKRDKRLREKLEGEMSGILNWVLKGCADWLEHGLGEAEAVTAATDSYRQESDALAEFISACCTVDELHTEFAGELYQAYKQFCEDGSEEPFSAQLFGRMLTERGFIGGQKKMGGKVVKIRSGISLAKETDEKGGR